MSRNGILLSFLNTYARGNCTELIEKEGLDIDISTLSLGGCPFKMAG